MTLALREVSIAGYRSLRRIRFPVEAVTVLVGANGVGKTNLYRTLQLVQAAAAGTFARELAAEGGMGSALWAGERRAKEPARIILGVRLASREAALLQDYEISAGLVPQPCGVPSGAAFLQEPQVKSETLAFVTGSRRAVILNREGPSGFVRDQEGRRQIIGTSLLASETALGSLQDPARYPDLHAVRQTMLGWRFYHGFRVDLDAPLRRPALAVTTPTLSSDGADLAAVFATLTHIRQDTADLDRAIEDAFPGARLVVPMPGRMASFGMIFPEYPKRVFETSELSDGTLRYLALAGALLAYRLPPFVALNEPETSLHPDLLDPLANLIARAGERTQLWVVTHSDRLAAGVAQHCATLPRRVVKKEGETWIEGLGIGGRFGDDE